MSSGVQLLDYADPQETCGSSYETGGADPSGTGCELLAGHTGGHVGPEPICGDVLISWTGGGYCAGDPLPVRNVQLVECSWWALCERPAAVRLPHPILGPVPTCQECADKLERLGGNR